jgi:hypothetical protein
MVNKNRNQKTEAIRLPVRVVDFLRDMSEARGIDHCQMIEIMAGQWIEMEKSRYGGLL